MPVVVQQQVPCFLSQVTRSCCCMPHLHEELTEHPDAYAKHGGAGGGRSGEGEVVVRKGQEKWRRREVARGGCVSVGGWVE